MSNYKIPRQSDRDIAAKAGAIHRDIANGELSIKFEAFAQGWGQVKFPEQDNAAWQRICAAGGAAITTFWGSLPNGVSFRYYRGGEGNQRNPYFDELVVALPGADVAATESAAKLLALFRPLDGTPSREDAEAGVLAVRAIQESTLARLERMHEEGLRKASEYRAQLEAEHRSRVEVLEAEVAAKKANLDDDAAKAVAALDQRAADLRAREKALDDSDNTHARRKIRDSMLADVKERVQAFGVSAATAKKRLPVAVGMMGLALLLLCGVLVTWIDLRDSGSSKLSDVAGAVEAVRKALAVASGASASAATPISVDAPGVAAERVALWVRLTLLSFGLAATLLYYIRWQNKWADQHAASEFELQQFHIDVNRANWVIESCLEWRKATASAIPGPLLEGITRGLFTARAEAAPHPPLNPADELASALLGTASKVKLKAGESEVEFDKPAKIAKTTEKSGT